MVKVINGKKYSTDTAKVVAYYNNIDGFRILQCNDAKFFEKTLYKKRTGEYFICTEGNNRSGVEIGIEPVSEEGAKNGLKYISMRMSTNAFGEKLKNNSPLCRKALR